MNRIDRETRHVPKRQDRVAIGGRCPLCHERVTCHTQVVCTVGSDAWLFVVRITLDHYVPADSLARQ